MDEQLVMRGILIEQTRKELLDELIKFYCGKIHGGQMAILKDVPLEGNMLIIPDSDFKEIFKR